MIASGQSGGRSTLRIAQNSVAQGQYLEAGRGINWRGAMPGSGQRMKEFTLRGVILGVLITLVFTAANVYLGLKVGLTFATSIPAAVISMAVLKALPRNSTIVERN